MIAPFYKFNLFGTEISLVIAFVIGIAFGFALERGGFGNARMLAAQFYFTDMRVFKVMFTAIVTAMTGIYFLSVLEFVDLSKVYVGNTYLLPQITGGLVLGVGFIMGGCCPGTSFASACTGKVDGLTFVLGLAFGIFVFGEMFPLIDDFVSSTNMGVVTLPDFFNISYGTVVFIVILIAIGGFSGAEWVENKMRTKKQEG
jgi:uncharacterized membrane protein YedE/YeeE